MNLLKFSESAGFVQKVVFDFAKIGQDADIASASIKKCTPSCRNVETALLISGFNICLFRRASSVGFSLMVFFLPLAVEFPYFRLNFLLKACNLHT